MKTIGQIKYEEFCATVPGYRAAWEELPPSERQRWELKTTIAANAITERHILFAREVVALARKHQMEDISMKFSQDLYSKQPDHQVNMEWSPRSHDAEDDIYLTSSFSEYVSEKVNSISSDSK